MAQGFCKLLLEGRHGERDIARAYMEGLEASPLSSVGFRGKVLDQGAKFNLS